MFNVKLLIVVPNSPHTNRGWKDDFKANYSSLIVAKCSAAAQEAIARDEDIKVVENEF
jgi:hypothetical protein